MSVSLRAVLLSGLTLKRRPLQDYANVSDDLSSKVCYGFFQSKFWILRAYVWVVRPPILGNESLLTNTERAPGNRVAKYRARPQAARRYAA